MKGRILIILALVVAGYLLYRSHMKQKGASLTTGGLRYQAATPKRFNSYSFAGAKVQADTPDSLSRSR